MSDQLGDRFKSYENAFRHILPKRSNLILRIDGKAFHTYTRGCEKPYDRKLMDAMDETALHLCENIQGAKFAHTFSDEISIVINDYETLNTDAWFGNNIQKMVSVGASIATAKFNQIRVLQNIGIPSSYDGGTEYFWYFDPGLLHEAFEKPLANFDARIFIVPELAEVANYFVWRTSDAARNSLQMFARSLYSHKELDGKNSLLLHDLIHSKGENWNDCLPRTKRGSLIAKNEAGKFSALDIPDSHGFEYWNNLTNKICTKGS
jgi:tRNA(His) 5'-end guanylyltransferase